MTSTKPIPILVLPHLALEEVILNFDPFEQINLSLCSKRCKLRIKRSIPKNRYEIAINFHDEYSLTICSYKGPAYEFNSESMDKRRRFREPTDPHLKLMKWTDYICDVFNTSITKMFLSKCHRIEMLEEINNWIKNRQQNYPEFCDIDTHRNLSQDYFRYLMRHFHTKHMYLTLRFGYVYNYKMVFNQEKLKLFHSTWFTYANLRTATCTQIEMVATSITCTQMNEFLSGWTNGSFPNLEYMVLSVKHQDYRHLYDGIDVMRVEERKRTYQGIFGGIIEEIADGKRIRRNDGVVAAIECNPDEISLLAMDNPLLYEWQEVIETDVTQLKFIVTSLFLS